MGKHIFIPSKELKSVLKFISVLKEIPREDRSRLEEIIIGTYRKRETVSKDKPEKDSA